MLRVGKFKVLFVLPQEGNIHGNGLYNVYKIFEEGNFVI